MKHCDTLIAPRWCVPVKPSGVVLTEHAVAIRDGRIVDVVARGLSPLPPIVIDARDLTIIPGLIDMHAHQSGLSGERLGRIWLGYGVTTVREVDSEEGDALERELQIKGWSRAKKEALIKEDWDAIHQIVRAERQKRRR